MSELPTALSAQSGAVPAGGLGGPEAEVLEIPAVVAVVVACNPGEHFAETLASLGNQDYENLSVLVVDAGSDHPIADQVAEVLPEAYLHRLAGDPGWSVAANQSIELVSGSPFLLFCHDDVALEPDCVSQLMGELYRNNGGIAGPKLVRWNDDRRLLQLGMGCDRFGVTIDQVDQGEFDQDQYDSVRDVFVIPGAVQLIRADLFAALGGFDPAIKMMGEDVDLCWRSHAAGARVIVVPSAKARHMESMKDRIGARERRRLLTRHRLRTVLATATRRSFLTVVPLALLLILIESFYSLLAGRRGQAKDVLAAIPWNLARLDDLRRKRRQVKKTRAVPDKAIQRLQASGSARLAAFSRGQFSAGQDRFSVMLGSVRSSFRGEDAGNVRDATVIGTLLAVLVVFGSRHLLTRGVAPVGQIPDLPTAGTMLREWLGGWRTVGTGGAGNAPSALPLLALGRSLFFWSPGLFDTLTVVGPVLLAPIGVYRLVRPLASPRAGALGALVYVCNPVVVSALSAARWEALIVYASMPIIVGSLLRVAGVSPFGSNGGLLGPTIADRNLPVRLIRYGFAVALVAAFAPSIVPIAAVTALVLAVVALIAGSGGRPQDIALAAVVGVVAPVALHGPWSFDFLRDLSWRWVVGPASPEASYDSLFDLIRFAPGSPAPSLLALGVIALAAVGLLIAHRDVFLLAAQGWGLALAFLAVLWFDLRGWFPVSIPAAEAMLAPVALGLTLAFVVGVVSFEAVVVDRRWPRAQRIIGAAGVLAVASVFAVGLSSSLDGRWGTPVQGFSFSTQFLVDRQISESAVDIGPGRVLWIGDAGVVPLDVARSPAGVEYAVTDGGRAEARGRWIAGPVGASDGIGAQLDLARSGEVVRLGRLLAPYGIDNVVVVDQLAPAPYVGPKVEPDRRIVRALEQQLDLERVPGVPNLVVFRNTSSGGIAPALPNVESGLAATAVEQLDVDLTTAPNPIFEIAPGTWLLNAPADRSVLVALHSDGLRASGARTELAAGFDELTFIPPGPGGEVILDYGPALRRRLALIGQFLLVAIGGILAQTRRESVL